MDINEAMATHEIAEYDQFRARVDELREICNFIPDASTQEGYEKSKRLALDVRKIGTALEAERKRVKGDVLEKGKLIDSEASALNDEIEEMRGPHKDAYQAVDARKKREKAEAERLIEVRLDDMRTAVVLAGFLDVDTLRATIVATKEIDPEEGFGDRINTAYNVRQDTIGKLESMLAGKLEQAERDRLAKEEADRLESQRQEQEAKQAELDKAAEKAREEQEAKQRQVDAENQRISDEQAAKQREIEEREAKIRKTQEEQERREFEIQAAADAKERAEREAEERRRRDEQEAAAQVQEEANKQARLEAQQPDLEKLRKYSENLQRVTVPLVVDKDVNAQLEKVLHKLEEISVMCGKPVNYSHS